MGRGAGDNEKTANSVTRTGAASAPPTYTPDFELQPGDQLVVSFPERVSSMTGETIPAQEYAMTVADPAYDEKDRVVIVEETHRRVLGNRNASPAVRRYKRNSKKLLGREVRRKQMAEDDVGVVVIDNDGKELQVGGLVVDGTLPDYKGPAPKVVEITPPKDGSCIVKLGGQDAAEGEWSSMLLALAEPDGKFRANVKLLGFRRSDGSFETV